MTSVFRIKQKFWSWGGKFNIQNEEGQVCYQVQGSVLKWLKSFEIRDTRGELVSTVQRNFTIFLPRFEVTVVGQAPFVIQQKWTWLRPRFVIENFGLEILGNFWDMNFELLQDGVVIARIDQEWFKLTSTYNVTVYDESYQDLVISLVIALDQAKAERGAE